MNYLILDMCTLNNYRKRNGTLLPLSLRKTYKKRARNSFEEVVKQTAD